MKDDSCDICGEKDGHGTTENYCGETISCPEAAMPSAPYDYEKEGDFKRPEDVPYA